MQNILLYFKVLQKISLFTTYS